MTSCTYRFKNASGEEVTITGQAEMKAFLADGGLEQLLPGKVLPWGGKQGAREKYSGPNDVSSRNGQMELANRAGTIAALKGMNAQLRAIDPSEAWADSNIEQSSDLDALRNQISEALVKAFRGKQQINPLRKRLEESSGQELKAVFDVMGLAGARMLHGDRVDALMAEDAKAVSDALDSVTGVDAAPNSDEKPAKRSEAADKPFALSDLDALQSSLQDGSATVEQYQSAWQAFKQSQDAIKAELTKKTKPQLLDMVGGMLAYRLKGDNKPEIVKAVFEAARNIFSLSREYGPASYFMGEYQKYQEAKDKAFAEMVEATTAEDLKAYADKVAEAETERRKSLDEFEKAIEDPQTLDDFRKYVTAKLRQGMSESEVRMSLTPEQRARMDELHAEYARKSRASRPAPAVTAASVTTGGDIVATKHTKTGEDLYVVRPAERVEHDQYNIWNATAKRMGGWYSSFRGNGAVPGFQFKTRESADAFLAYVGGDTEGAKQVVQERRDAFADDRSQSAVERLTEMADRLEDRADESLSRDRKANTARRASMAASAEASANADKAMARTMRNIANAIKDGKAKFLDKVRQKVQVEMLRSFVSDAKYKHLTALYPSYVDFERNRHEPATAETADYATFPKYTADRADLARMGRELELIDGAKKLGQQLLKVADDVTDEYLKFVKENLNKVSTFRAGGGGPAIFSSRDDAERAIARSGFRGKAIVYSAKRGQNMVVMGPSMAKENGLWTADTSKRITLTDEVGEEITAKIESLNRNRERVYLPHQFSTTRERRAKLKAMGIETAAEFRAALREFIALSEAPSRPSKVKELERSMVGRKNDGLDFFPTPAGIAQQMIEAADIKDGMRVLEPSAGMGHIAEQIRESGVDPDVVEFSSSRRELLEAKGFNVVANDFMEASGEYDRIIMNPPFSDRRDAQHVQHAYGLLKPGGRLVAIMGEGVFFGQDKKATEFREWLDSVGGTSEKLPDGSFLDPSLPVNTGVNARMVVIEKSEDAPAESPKVEAKPTAIDDGDAAPKFSRASNPLPNTITIDGVDRPTTNSAGKPIHPTEEGLRNFWRWFGDSKVVDEQGRPLVVYHGTAKDFTEFDLSRTGESTGNTGFYGAGAYFSQDGEDAGGYALWARRSEDDAANVISVYLALQNPLYLHINPKDDARRDRGRVSLNMIVDQLVSEGYFGKNPDKNEAGSLYARLTSFLEKADFERFMGTLYNELKGGEAVSDLARRAGFDGVMAEGFKKGENFLAEVVAFSPEQIKSAIGNTGAFDPSSPDIRRSAAAPSSASGITAESLPGIFAQRFPKLAGAIKTMLDRGALGQKGGLVVLDTNDETQIAREFADRTGRTFDETVQMFESGAGPEINGFYDPLSGTTFLVGPNLDGDTASAVVMHEVVHGQQRRSLDEKSLALIQGRAKLPLPLGKFLTRVAQRMEDAGESNNATEATAYIVELAVQEGRQAGFSAADGPILAWIEKNIGKPVADLVREFVAMARAWALAHGVELKRIAVDDLVAYAKLGLKRAADGRVVTFGRESGSVAAMSERQGVAGKQAPTPAGDVEAEGAKPDFNAAAEQILAAIQSDDSYSDFGLRVIPGEFSGPVAIGDSIPNSFVWNNGDKTDEEIPGVSTAGIDSPTLQSVVRAIKNLGAHGKAGPNGYYFGDRIVLVKGERVSSGEDVGETIIAGPEVVGIWRKPTQGNSELIPNEPTPSGSPGVSFSRASKAALGPLSATQQSTVERIFGKPKTLRERAEAFAKDWQKNLVQGIFDQFAPIKELTSKGYMLARLAKGGDSTLEALMMYGKVSVDADGVYKVDFDGKNLNGFAKTMAKLDGEHDRFLAWVSGQRAERLSGVGLENLMTPADIAALQSLADGNTKSGKVRRALYADALKDLNAFNDSVLKIAADSGLIDDATREMYRDVPYVPFYRLSEEDVVQGPSVSKGLVNQAAWKQLKGGTNQLNEDLMGNLLKNWSHLITASANNRAAKEVLDTAARMGAATDMTNDVVAQDINGQPIYRGNTKGLVRYRGEIKRKIPKGQPYVENGQTLISDGTAEISYVGDRYFKVDDPHLMDAIGSIGFTTKVWKPMADFKRYLTFGVTVNPTFKIRNLIRDSIQAVGTAELSYNPVQNILMGAKGTAMMSNVRAQMLASGGMLRFGSAEGGYSGHVRRLIEKGVDPQYILDDDNKIKSFWKHKVLPAFEAYQELGDRSENVNRAALYEQLLTKGMSHAEASFWARDMMDFSMHGKWSAIRTLTAVVPFMNARLQGIYKLGRATKADYRRMGATLAAVSVASMALMLAYGDDDDWKKREDWDRDNSWWFKVGGVAFRIPKPFEVGAVGTIAERSLELLISDEMTGKRFGQRMRDLLMHNLSMNPTPQLIKPMIDLYANKDGFSGREIETQGMEKLRPEDRYTNRTSEVARFLGQIGLPNPAQLLMGRVEGLSPVQIDHLIRGYFAWVGTSATTALDYGIRPMMDRGDRPDMRLKDVFLVGNFVESLPSGSSRYVTQLYEQAKEIEQMYASYQQAIKEGNAEKAQEIRADNAEGFAARRRIESAKRAQSLISGQMRTIERSKEMSGDEKRARLDQLEKQRDRLARQALLVPAAPGRD